MSRVLSIPESKMTVAQLIAKVKRASTPFEIPVPQSKMVVLVMQQREYDQLKALRFAQKLFANRPRKTPAQHLAETTRVLRGYEKKYKMTSAEFYRRFQAAELEELPDFFDWRVEYNAYRNLKEKIANGKRQTA
ncbi:MAG: hypothetical protein HZC40_03565 [Chloroflexi bacterium]|nr:hypothetical protein [Chloroflexota bacterium]